jgi:arylsulfatase A-like enzyme
MDRAFGKLRQELRTLDIAENTILWYTSDNGGLNEATSGGRAKKRSIYEGGLRVPALLEWPSRILEGRITKIPSVSSDIYPTLVELASVEVENQLPLDGISLVDLIDEKMETRSKPIGFWLYPKAGRLTYGDRMMQALLEAQEAGHPFDPEGRLDLDAAVIKVHYPDDEFLGHAAWLDYPWKLHRIVEDGQETLELYNLDSDPGEVDNLWDNQTDRATRMNRDLAAWQRSVIQSLNGEDYP